MSAPFTDLFQSQAGDLRNPIVAMKPPAFNEYHVVGGPLNSIAKIDDPRGRLEIQGLDLSRIHRTDRTSYKAGALENGLHSARGEFVFILDVEGPAERPEDIDGFKSQLHRWSKGSIHTCLKPLPAVWRTCIPLALKFEAMVHLTSNFACLLLVLVCLLTLFQSHSEASVWSTGLVDLPIFLATTVSIFAFYAITLWQSHPHGWIKKNPLLPGLIALGVGMAVSNARSVLEAIFKKQSEFSRTPKRGDRSGQAVPHVTTRTRVPIIEALFAGGFVYVSALFFASRWRPLHLRPSTATGHLEILQKISLAILIAPMLFLGSCATDTRNQMIISAADQKMVVIRDGKPARAYPVSTSKFGLGDKQGSYATPLGKLRIKKKIGNKMPAGAVFKGRVPTGEVLPVNAPGRDPIVTRILWLEGLEPSNRNAFSRYIYIHGTPEERNIGQPVSFGCIRMRSCDVIELFESIGENAQVFITPKPLPRALAQVGENTLAATPQGEKMSL